MATQPRIPVVMYHTVGTRLNSWLWANLTIGVDLFARQIQLLKAHGYRSLFLDELRYKQEKGVTGRAREVVLTFDDGYLDNWVFAYPLLKREGWCGTIYVNPEFIDPSEEPRLTLEDVWQGKCQLNDLTVHGFLNRAELRLLQESGVMQIGSHSMSHTWYPTTDMIEDFHRPDLDTPWLSWNAQPVQKFAYLTNDQRELVPYGHPIHTHGRSLGIRQYLPDPKLAANAIEWVRHNGGTNVFQRPDWSSVLREAVAPYIGTGRLETDSEMMARFRSEIFDSKSILEEILGVDIPHFCWPGGAYCAESWPLAEQAGHQTICVARNDTVRWQSDDPSLVRRIGSSDFVTWQGKRYPTEDPQFILLACEIELGHRQQKWPMRFRKVLTAARSGFVPKNRSI